MLPVILVHLWCTPNKLVLRKDTDIIHVAMGGGQKSFYTFLRGVQKVLAACEGGGSKKFDDKNCQLPSPPPQSIYEHSLTINNRGLRRKELSSWRGGNYCLGDLKFGRVGRSDQLSLINFEFKILRFVYGLIRSADRIAKRHAPKSVIYTTFWEFFWNLTCWVLLVFARNWAMATLEKIFMSILLR